MHLLHRGRRTARPTPTPIAPATTEGGTLLESCRAREQSALALLEAAVGGRPLCSRDPGIGSPPTAKEHEGAAAALAEARRAIRRLPAGPAQRDAVLEVLARWRGQVDSTGRAGRAWADYLRGGLAALDHLIDDDEGLTS